MIPERGHAGVFDRRAEGSSECFGVDPGSQYIAGYGGIGWYEYFTDSKTGEVYRVRCSDGVNGGSNAHSKLDSDWRGRCYSEIYGRVQYESRSGVAEIRISRNEGVILEDWAYTTMLIGWFSPASDLAGNFKGLLGYCNGVPVIVDSEQSDRLPPRISREAIKDALRMHMKTPSHQELGEGEYFIGYHKGLVNDLPWKTRRVGNSVSYYDEYEERMRRKVPIFVQKSEVDEAIEELRKWEESKPRRS